MAPRSNVEAIQKMADKYYCRTESLLIRHREMAIACRVSTELDCLRVSRGGLLVRTPIAKSEGARRER